MQSYNKPITLTTTIPVKTLEKTSPCFSPFFNCLEEQKKESYIAVTLFFKWYHQKMSYISKWLYIFALKNRNKRNLPLLLHLISAPFCSVSQSRVPTLMQR